MTSYSHNVKQPTTSKIELLNFIKRGQITKYSKKTINDLFVNCFNIALEYPSSPAAAVVLLNGDMYRVVGPAFNPLKQIQVE